MKLGKKAVGRISQNGRSSESPDATARAIESLEHALLTSRLISRASLAKFFDPVGLVKLISECTRPLRFDLRVIKTSTDSGQNVVRFHTLLRFLGKNVPVLPFHTAMEIATLSDRIRQNLAPMEPPGASFDVGLHFETSSSFASKGRLLSTAVRILRPIACLELGTAYGMSAFFILSQLERLGQSSHLTTIEGIEPQYSLASKILCSRFGASVDCRKANIDSDLNGILDNTDPLDFVFHDAGHLPENYTRDFDLLERRMTHGALLVLDDVHYVHPTAGKNCYQAWLQIVEHPRVREAVELNGLGLALLR